MAAECGQLVRGKVCGRHAAVVLQIGNPATPLGACQNHVGPLVLEYVDSRGSIIVGRAR